MFNESGGGGGGGINLEVSQPLLATSLAKETTKKTLDALPLDGNEKQELVETLQKAVDLALQLVQKLSEDKNKRSVGEKDPEYDREYYESTAEKIERSRLVVAKLTDDEMALLQQRFLVEAIGESKAPYELKVKVMEIYGWNKDAEWNKVSKSPITNWINKTKKVGPEDQFMSRDRLLLLDSVVSGIFYGPSEMDPISFKIKRSGYITSEQRQRGDLATFSSSGLPDHMKSKDELEAEGLKREYYHDTAIATTNILNNEPELAQKARAIRDHIVSLVNKYK